jgi:hypothetical protein
MPLDDLITATEDDCQLYAALMENPAHFELDHPDMPWDEMLCLH